jgi:ubiquitin carboxyl-terminal hydrolase 47
LSEHLNETLSNIGIEINKRNILTLKPPTSKIIVKTAEPEKTTESLSLTTTNSKEKKSIVPKIEESEKFLSSKMIASDVELSDKQQAIAVETEISSDDDLALGASASPTEDTSSSPPVLPALFDTTNDATTSSYEKTSSFRRCDYELKSKFVGLVNQAMTCYLNSLLQALYMTPEFRNALYDWEFDGSGESKSIPFQLQKLFVNLQTSSKNAVETTDLTKSFGWDSTEAWQQHDIQELTRVLFDALEHKFKNTKHADLINNLYEGKMIDYVKCLECETEKSREDTFLDIPLPVRPFGSTNAYESIEEAMKGFVTPETLDGNNQYFCEKCNKKCDAHKGLKFKKFPYLLTLHLKRFDFDYNTLNRIKLNDKVTFPQQFNLNGFITEHATKPNDITSIGSVESAVKSDDCSTTDSVLDEDGSQCNQNHYQESTQDYPDEGIDMSVNGDCKSLMSNSTSIDSASHSGPYVYDLFAIMIHSGSASGGHYYAYIKDFETGNWYSFNDTSVTPITQEDICKSFGGSGALKNYYSSFSSSTNAYMLMYRQHDQSRNSFAIKEELFPKHIQNLAERLKNHDDDKARSSEKESQVLTIKVHFKNPLTKEKTDNRIYITGDSLLKEVLEQAYTSLKVKSVAPVERCRLVAYNSSSDFIEKSLENLEDVSVYNVMSKLMTKDELLLEVKNETEDFEVYEENGISTKVFSISNNAISGPTDIRAYNNKTFKDLKIAISKKFKMSHNEMILANQKSKEKPKILEDDMIVKDHFVYGENRVYMTLEKDELKFTQMVEKFNNVIVLYFTLPASNQETLEKLSIPSYDDGSRGGEDDVDSVAFYVPPTKTGECNSEDSSLSSNSDRTLVDDSHFSNFTALQNNITEDELYFNAFVKHEIPPVDADDNTDKSSWQKLLKVFVDKRMNVNTLKEKLQPLVKIPMEYFRIFHVSQIEDECTNLKATINITFKDEERLVIEYGRVLQPGENKVKLHYLNINDEETSDLEKLPVICEYIVRDSMEIGQLKREIIEHIRTLDNKYANLTYEKTRLRKKGYKGPTGIYLDDQKVGDDYMMKMSANRDMIIQELASEKDSTHDIDGEPIDDDSKLLFIRQFYPSKLEFGRFQEIVINSKLLDFYIM